MKFGGIPQSYDFYDALVGRPETLHETPFSVVGEPHPAATILNDYARDFQNQRGHSGQGRVAANFVTAYVAAEEGVMTFPDEPWRRELIVAHRDLAVRELGGPILKIIEGRVRGGGRELPADWMALFLNTRHPDYANDKDLRLADPPATMTGAITAYMRRNPSDRMVPEPQINNVGPTILEGRLYRGWVLNRADRITPLMHISRSARLVHSHDAVPSNNRKWLPPETTDLVAHAKDIIGSDAGKDYLRSLQARRRAAGFAGRITRAWEGRS